MTRNHQQSSGEHAIPNSADDFEESFDRVEFNFHLSLQRREFVQMLGVGLLIAVSIHDAPAQPPPIGRRRRGGFAARGPSNLAARLHIATNGIITVMTGKVECGQGSRAELTQAAAEELHIKVDRLRLIMADTSLVPDDGGTAGSRSTPSTLPAIRQACAAARELLANMAAKRWGVDPKAITIRDGKARTGGGEEHGLDYTDLASDKDAAVAFAKSVPSNVFVSPVAEWTVLGTSVPRPNGRDIVTGSHQYPSDILRPGMQYGKVLRPPSYGAQLVSIDLDLAKQNKAVTVIRDGQFVGVVAPNTFAAEGALEELTRTAKWEASPHPPSARLSEYLRQHARGGVPANPFREHITKAPQSLKQSYDVAYVQHCPMETRAALAEWDGGKLTVWTATQMPFGVRGELVRAFGLSEDAVRVIVPDFGGGFGGKHSGECAVEAARLAKATGRPVRLQWTRAEEFTWAQFRPAAVIDVEATLDEAGRLTSWHFLNINSGASSIQSPYRVGKSDCRFVASDAPLRHGSYRALAATANTFARECFMDELAEVAGSDPLEFRLTHLDEGRLRNVLVEAARRFGWAARSKVKRSDVGVGLACGLEKGSFVAACAQVAIDQQRGSIAVQHVCQAFECGKIINPANLLAQVQGAILMALGPALHEEIRFADGRIANAAFSRYGVPRFADVPQLDIALLDRPDLPSVGAGETPLIAVAPAVGNAVYAATGVRLRSLPMQLPQPKDV